MLYSNIYSLRKLYFFFLSHTYYTPKKTIIVFTYIFSCVLQQIRKSIPKRKSVSKIIGNTKETQYLTCYKKKLSQEH